MYLLVFHVTCCAREGTRLLAGRRSMPSVLPHLWVDRRISSSTEEPWILGFLFHGDLEGRRGLLRSCFKPKCNQSVLLFVGSAICLLPIRGRKEFIRRCCTWSSSAFVLVVGFFLLFQIDENPTSHQSDTEIVEEELMKIVNVRKCGYFLLPVLH